MKSAAALQRRFQNAPFCSHRCAPLRVAHWPRARSHGCLTIIKADRFGSWLNATPGATKAGSGVSRPYAYCRTLAPNQWRQVKTFMMALLTTFEVGLLVAGVNVIVVALYVFVTAPWLVAAFPSVHADCFAERSHVVTKGALFALARAHQQS